MGKGRAPCCDKSKVKKGPWTPAEDLKLISFIQKNGHGNWRSLPKQAGLLRCGKSCRLRWINYLRPDVKRGNFTPEEEDTIIKLHDCLGNRWSKIASYLPGRTDNEIKNVWNTHLKKRIGILKKDAEECHNMKSNSCASSPSNNNSVYSDSDHQMIDMVKGSVHHQDMTTTQEEFGDNNNNKGQYINDVASLIEEAAGSAAGSCSPTSSYSSLNLCNLSHVDQLSMANVDHVEVRDNPIDQLMIEIPSDSAGGTDNIDFWDMLLDTPINLDDSNHSDQSQHPASHYIQGSSENECQKWLRYLEIELGLTQTSTTGTNYYTECCGGFTSQDQNNTMQV